MIRSALACILSVAAAYGAQWTKTFPVSSPVQFRLRASPGSISITGWDRPEIAVSISPGNLAIKDVLTANRLELRVDSPESLARIQVQVPRAIDGEIQSSNGSVSISGIEGSLSLKGQGHMRVSGRFDLLVIENGFGDIDLRLDPGSRVSPRWSVKTDAGDITARVSAELRPAVSPALQTGAGRIRILPVKVK